MDIIQNISKTYNIKLFPIKESNNNLVWGSENIIVKKFVRKDNFTHEQEALLRLELLEKAYFPKIIDIYSSEKILLIEKLPGQDLEKIWEHISFEKKHQIYGELIQILHEIHTISAPLSYVFVNNRIEKYSLIHKKAKQNPYISGKKIEKIYQFFLETNISWNKLPCVLIHNDFWVKNIFSDTKKISGIIDFENGFYAPVVFEGLKIKRDLKMITASDCSDTSLQEIDFMKGFVSVLETQYPEIFNYSLDQYNNFYAGECLFKLSKYEEDWYDNKELELITEQLLFNN